MPGTGDDAMAKSIDYATYIGDAGRHLLEVVSDILDISKIESGTFTLNLERCSIAKIIGDCLPLVAERIEKKKQVLEVRLEKRIPQVDVDARRVRQILINLLSTANKFTPGRGRIMLVARANKDGGVTVAVVDSGIGMDAPGDRGGHGPPSARCSRTCRAPRKAPASACPSPAASPASMAATSISKANLGEGTSAVLTLPKPKLGGDATPWRRGAANAWRPAPQGGPLFEGVTIVSQEALKSTLIADPSREVRGLHAEESCASATWSSVSGSCMPWPCSSEPRMRPCATRIRASRSAGWCASRFPESAVGRPDFRDQRPDARTGRQEIRHRPDRDKPDRRDLRGPGTTSASRCSAAGSPPCPVWAMA